MILEEIQCPLRYFDDTPKPVTREVCQACIWNQGFIDRLFRGKPHTEVKCDAPICDFCQDEIALCKTPEQTENMEPVLIETAGGFHLNMMNTREEKVDVYWWHCGSDHCDKDFVYLLHKKLSEIAKQYKFVRREPKKKKKSVKKGGLLDYVTKQKKSVKT
jgi:hypothetical protein